MLKRPLLALLVLALSSLPCGAQAQRASASPALPAKEVSVRSTPAMTREAPVEERIVAVVNEDIISSSDLRSRIALALLSSGLPDSPEVRQHILPQALRSLIDELLQLQEGKRLDIRISPEEIDRAMKRLAEDNRIPGGDMPTFLAAHNVPVSTLKEQIRAALTWNKVVQRELRPHVEIGDDEIDSVIERMNANAGKQEYLVSEIFIPVDNPADEEEAYKFANSLVQQIKGGASFGAIARQFSRGTGAANGGDIGWVQEGQMAEEVNKVLQTMQAGEVAGPIRSSSGFHIIGVREKRTIASGDPKKTVLRLQQAFHPFGGNKTKEDLLREAARIRQTINDCTDLKTRLENDFPAWRWQDLGETKLGDAPQWLAEKVRDTGTGRATDAMATDKGALIVFVCGRSASADINREEILNSIGTERLELLARRLLRDLRRNAHIEVRLERSPE